jgi:hypothetical protein
MNKEDNFGRNNYYYGKLMTVRDYFNEQCYFNEKRWLINRLINGWGVVCGLDVQLIKDVTDKVLVTPGLAIDCGGREILVFEEQEVPLIPVESECHKEKLAKEEGVKNLVICLEYHECKTEQVALPPIACDQKEKCEFNRIWDSFKIIPKNKADVDMVDPYGKYCPLSDNKLKSLHGYLCEKLKDGCPECPKRPCLLLAEVTIIPSSADPNNPPTIKIDPCSKRKLVYNNPLLYDLIKCLHYNYIGTWLVLGPIFNTIHQEPPHFPGDGHPLAQDIISHFDTTAFNPETITSDINEAPKHEETIHYKNEAIEIAAVYTWRTRSFSDMDWMNIHDIEDDIHQHLPGDFDDPLDPDIALNFAGKHHVIAYFLVYILSPKLRNERLYIRSDDSVRVWLNGSEIDALRYAGERDIKDFREDSAEITLKEGTNILMAAVAETHVEWGFSARIEDDGGLRFTPIKPE